MRIQPKNWQELQHYKDRSPIWIKLHRKILDDYEYHCLPVASRALAPMLWLLASEYSDGIITGSEDKISFRLRMTVKEFVSALSPLISSGFFAMYHDASETIAQPEQDACIEKRREETEKEKRKKRIADFEIFWNAFAFKQGKGGAEKSWLAIQDYSCDLLEKIITGAKKEAARRPDILAAGRTPKWAQGWLTERRWEDDYEPPRLHVVPTLDHNDLDRMRGDGITQREYLRLQEKKNAATV